MFWKIVHMIRPRTRLKSGLAGTWRGRSFLAEILGSGIKAEEFFLSTRMFFIVGTGRSGTQWLSRILDEDRNADVFHEPDFFEDIKVMPKAMQNQAAALEYISKFKKYRIAKRIRKRKGPIYVEITGTLRHFCPALKQVFPNAGLFLCSRDGREVLRSVWPWPFYTAKSKGAYNLKPPPGNPFSDSWDIMTRFEKICWSWMNSYQTMLEVIPSGRIIHFERVIKDFDYFKERILQPTGILISQEQWERRIKIKSDNASASYAFPHWTEWSMEHKKAFDRICGEIMHRLRYDYHW